MRSFLLLLMVLVGCYCAPGSLRGGFNVGGSSQLDLSAGGMGEIEHDGLAFRGKGQSGFGGKWTGRGYGGGYAGLNDKIVSGRLAGRTALGAYVKPGAEFALGVDSKGKMPVGFNPSLGLEGIADVNGNGELAYGDDAKRLAELYGDSYTYKL